MLGIGVAEARESVAEGVFALLFSIIVDVSDVGGWERTDELWGGLYILQAAVRRCRLSPAARLDVEVTNRKDFRRNRCPDRVNHRTLVVFINEQHYLAQSLPVVASTL